jgi:hypothetical protein
MNKELFMTMVLGVREYDYYFVMKKYCTSMDGFSIIDKCTYTWLNPQPFKPCTNSAGQ